MVELSAVLAGVSAVWLEGSDGAEVVVLPDAVVPEDGVPDAPEAVVPVEPAPVLPVVPVPALEQLQAKTRTAASPMAVERRFMAALLSNSCVKKPRIAERLSNFRSTEFPARGAGRHASGAPRSKYRR
jgi:hypothetical protein